ncbi:putative protein kinase CAMK-OST1L family [Helianthus anomalus]
MYLGYQLLSLSAKSKPFLLLSGSSRLPIAKQIDENVAREVINDRSLRHPNIIRFREVVLIPTHLAIVMEYAAGGELFERICNAGRFSEYEARYFFQQLISGVHYCHFMVMEPFLRTLLDGSPAPRLKVCDFGYSKSSLLHSRPKSTVGTPAYIAPKVLSRREYDGKVLLTSCRYWFTVLSEHLPDLVDKAVPSEGGTDDARRRGDAFAHAFSAHLARLMEGPAGYGKLGLANLLELREECLLEFNFFYAYSTIKQRYYLYFVFRFL